MPSSRLWTVDLVSYPELCDCGHKSHDTILSLLLIFSNSLPVFIMCGTISDIALLKKLKIHPDIVFVLLDIYKWVTCLCPVHHSGVGMGPSKGSVLLRCWPLRADYSPTSRNARTTQTLQRSREPVLVLRRVLVSGPITALAAASPRWKVKICVRRTSGPCGGRKEGPQGSNGSVTPLRCVNVEP